MYERRVYESVNSSLAYISTIDEKLSTVDIGLRKIKIFKLF